MAPITAKKVSLAQQLEELSRFSTAPEEYDPELPSLRALGGMPTVNEADNDNEIDEDDSDNEEAAEDKGRDHYVNVGESQLRKQNQSSLLSDNDARYAGRFASREDIFRSFEIESGSDDDYSGLIADNSDILDGNVTLSSIVSEQTDNADILMEAAESEQEGEEGNENEANYENNDLAAELRGIERDEAEMIQAMTDAAKAEHDKGKHIKQQMTIWDQLLDMRIRMQKALVTANQAPRPSALPLFLQSTENDQSENHVSELLKQVQQELALLVQQMVNFQCSTTTQTHSAIRESIGAIQLPSEVNEENLNSNDDGDKADISIEPWWDTAQLFMQRFRSFRNESLDKWHDKAQGVTVGPSKKFKAINQSASAQINVIMNDRERLVRRSQLKRKPVTMLGDRVDVNDQSTKSSRVVVEGSEKFDDPGIENEIAQIEAKSKRGLVREAEYDIDVFDDGDFYQSMLRELIDRKMSTQNDADAMALHIATLKGQQRKHRKGLHGNAVVDTKASKGRKMRYHLHEKLQHFMAPKPIQLPVPSTGHVHVSSWHDDMVDELFNGLFGVAPVIHPSQSALLAPQIANQDDIGTLRLFA